MHKKIKFESFVYRFLYEAQSLTGVLPTERQVAWKDLLQSLQFESDQDRVIISFQTRSLTVSLDAIDFYVRGDSPLEVRRQIEAGLMEGQDPVRIRNRQYFQNVVRKVADLAGFARDLADKRLDSERTFHDAWAGSEDVSKIDVRQSNEGCTAPEMRFIHKKLGNLHGKRLLDIGCGLGEASVYFAIRGADVTSTDLSEGMLQATARLASNYGVRVNTHLAAAEDLMLPSDAKYDVIYAGNLLHHVDIQRTLLRLRLHLAPGGMLVTWDPIAYNPAINIYRKIATDVRTPDEHPLTWRDICLFRKHFQRVETRYFWLTTLAIFAIMVLVQRRNVNKERLWKVVVQEGEKWRWLYAPLERIDRQLLWLFPPLRLLCWNVVIVAKNNG